MLGFSSFHPRNASCHQSRSSATKCRVYVLFWAKGRYLLIQNIVLVNFLQVNYLHMQGLVCKGKVHQAKNKPWTGDSVG